jgi:hypothetical protein
VKLSIYCEKRFSATSWYSELVKYDFMTVVLHEIAHELNVYDSMRYSNGIGAWGDGSATADPNILDILLNKYSQ